MGMFDKRTKRAPRALRRKNIGALREQLLNGGALVALTSQHPMVIDDDTGLNVRLDINDAFQAQAGNQIGATEPPVMYAGQFWADTGTMKLKQRNSSNTAWVVRFLLDKTALLTVNTKEPDANGDVTLAVNDIEGAVSDEIEINGHPLTEDITLTAEDLDAVSSDGGDVNGPLVIITDGVGLILENITPGVSTFIQARGPGTDFLWFMGYSGDEDLTIQNYAANNFFYLKSDGTIQLAPSAGKPVSITGQVVPTDYSNFDSRYSANLTYLPPEPTQEEILRANTARYERLLVAASAAAFPLQSAMAQGTITPEQQTMLTALQNFSIALVDADLTKSPVNWPPLPAGIKLPLI